MIPTRKQIDECVDDMYRDMLEEVATHPELDDCPDPECLICGIRSCPEGEPLHYHHDGCPACSLPRY